MDTGSLVSEDTLIGDRFASERETQRSALQNRFGSAGPAAEQVRSNTNRNRDESSELRSIVAGRFMRMLRSHDRVRSKLLAEAMK
jgi:hypothetical protein